MGGGVYVVSSSSSPVMMISSCNSIAAAAAQFSLSVIIIMMCCSQQQQLVVEAANYHRPSPSPLAASPAAPAEFSSSRRPNTSVALILGLLTAIFSLTFILLILYVKHCTNTVITTPSTTTRPPPPYYSGGRNNSGIDRRLIESLPVFRFSNNNSKLVEGECAVCLTPFDAADVLRLLPKCKHAFHVECVDTWLDAHSTCPLCRVRVHADDLLLLIDIHQIPPPDVTVPSAGEINQQHKRSIIKTTTVQEWATSFRRSLDDGAANFKKMKTAASVISCFDRSGGARKDGLLLLRTNGNDETTAEEERRKRRLQIRWSDVQPSSHLLYLRSQMMLLHTHTSSLSEEEEEEEKFTGFTRFQFPTATS